MRSLQLLALAAGIDEAVEGHDVGLDADVQHALQDGERPVHVEGLATGPDEGSVWRDRRMPDVMHGRALDHALQYLKASLQVLGLRTRVNDRREGVRVGVHPFALHEVQELACLGELLALAARIDEGGVRVHRGLQSRAPHLVVIFKGSLEFLSLPAGIDEDVERHGVGRLAGSLHLLHDLQHGEPEALLLVCGHE